MRHYKRFIDEFREMLTLSNLQSKYPSLGGLSEADLKRLRDLRNRLSSRDEHLFFFGYIDYLEHELKRR